MHANTERQRLEKQQLKYGKEITSEVQCNSESPLCQILAEEVQRQPTLIGILCSPAINNYYHISTR